ncbi:MAG: hypothetical protein GXP48_09605 [Acidobacteria bacterium]|nr:hypothetical protein [Acidobacteriota bacterium]
MKPIGEMGTQELEELVRTRELDQLEALEVLRNPYCSLSIVESILQSEQHLQAHAVRERIAGFPGLEFGTALHMLGTLPWLSLVHVAQNPRTPPLIRRNAERVIVRRVHGLTLGELVALARCAHRPLIRLLTDQEDERVLEALLDNPRMAENDVLFLLRKKHIPPGILGHISGHRRWGNYTQVRVAVAVHPNTPLPVSLSILVRLSLKDLEEISSAIEAPPEVKRGARQLVQRRREETQSGGRIRR